MQTVIGPLVKKTAVLCDQYTYVFQLDGKPKLVRVKNPAEALKNINWVAKFGLVLPDGTIEYEVVDTGCALRLFSWLLEELSTFVVEYDPYQIDMTIKNEKLRKAEYDYLNHNFLPDFPMYSVIALNQSLMIRRNT